MSIFHLINFKDHTGQTSTELQNRCISGPTKSTYVLQTFFWKKTLNLNIYTRKTVNFTEVVIVLLQPMLIVASTLLDLVKNLKSFAGILVVSIHSFQYQNCEHTR